MERFVLIFSFILVATFTFANEKKIIINSTNHDKVLDYLIEHQKTNSSLGVEYLLKDFDYENYRSIYSSVSIKKKIDTLITNDDLDINMRVLKQISKKYYNTTIDSDFTELGRYIVSRYYFINDVPYYRFGILNKQSLGAAITYVTNFESFYSGIIGISHLDDSWVVNGDINIQAENYFKSAERLNVNWKKLDSFSQTISLAISSPHPFGLKSGIDFKYIHEIFNGLFTLYEFQTSITTFSPIFHNISIGYVVGESKPTNEGSEKFYTQSDYKAFSFTSNRNSKNRRITPNKGSLLKINIRGGVDGNLKFILADLFFNKFQPLSNFSHLDIKYIAKNIKYLDGTVPKTRYFRFGGTDLRGYNDKTFEYPKYSIISCGLNYTPSSNLQFEVFSDLGSSSLYFNSKNWFGYGIGLSQINNDYIIKIEYALSDYSFENGKIHITWSSRI